MKRRTSAGAVGKAGWRRKDAFLVGLSLLAWAGILTWPLNADGELHPEARAEPRAEPHPGAPSAATANPEKESGAEKNPEKSTEKSTEESDDKEAAKAASRAKAERRKEEKTALKAIQRGAATRDAEMVNDAALALAKLGGEGPMSSLLERLVKVPASENSIYWAMIRAAVSFNDREGMQALGDFVMKKKSTAAARDLVYALARNRSPNAIYALRPLVLDGPEDLRLLAASSAGAIRSPQTVDLLIELMDSEEREHGDPTRLVFMAAESLKALTHQDFGPSATNWSGWWKKNRDKPLPRTPLEESTDATGTAVDYVKLDPARRDEFFGLEKGPPQAIVVLSARFTKKVQKDYNNDHMERVLESMGLPHQVVLREDFLAFDLSQTSVLLINCAQFHEHCICPTCKPGGTKNNRLYRCQGCDKHVKFSARLKGPAIKKIRSFVNRGGYLFCEDWTVKEVVEAAFPKFVTAGKKLKQGTADVQPARGRGTHPYLKGIFVPKLEFDDEDLLDEDLLDDGIDLGLDDDEEDDNEGRTVVVGLDEDEEDAESVEPLDIAHEWSIDDESFAFDIKNRRAVHALLASSKVQKVTDGQSAVALAFRPGPIGAKLPPGRRAPAKAPGVVMVVLSHFGKQNTSEDEHSIQNLLVNFLLDAHIQQGGSRTGKKPSKGGKAKKGKKAAGPDEEAP